MATSMKSVAVDMTSMETMMVQLLKQHSEPSGAVETPQMIRQDSHAEAGSFQGTSVCETGNREGHLRPDPACSRND